MPKPQLATIPMPEPEAAPWLRRHLRRAIFALLHDTEGEDLTAASVVVVVDGWRVTLTIEPNEGD